MAPTSHINVSYAHLQLYFMLGALERKRSSNPAESTLCTVHLVTLLKIKLFNSFSKKTNKQNTSVIKFCFLGGKSF